MAGNGVHMLGARERPTHSPRATGEPGLNALGRRRQRRQNAIAWALVAIILAVQFAAWREFCLRGVVWAYPTNFDQLAYLEQSYQTYDRIMRHGLVTGLEEGMGMKFGHLPMNAAGATLHLQAALLFLLTGPLRLCALSLNFIYWAALQIALVATLRWLTRAWGPALLGLGLLLTIISPFFATGGSLFDFRLDFIAFCLFGVFICAVIRSGVFADWRWSAAAGLAGAALGTFRFISLAYLLGIFAALGLFLLAQWMLAWGDNPRQRAAARRIGGLLIAGLVIAIIAGPVLWHHREAIRSYYGLHVSGEEKTLRAEQSGTTTLRANLSFYAVSLIRDHAGDGFWIVSYLVVVLSLGYAIVRGPRKPVSPAAIDLSAAFGFLVICVVVPYAILTHDEAKSPIVGGIMAVPVLWLVVLAALVWAGAARRLPTNAGSRRFVGALALFAMMAGAYQQFSQYSRRTLLAAHRAEAEKINAMWDRVATDCQAMGWSSPVIAPDALVDFLNQKVLTILAYERHGILLDAGAAIGRLEKYDAKELYDRLALSDFAIITKNTGPPVFEFPFDTQMRLWHEDLLAWCRQNMVELEHDDLGAPFWRDMRLFVRPGVGLRAADDGWITSDGLEVTALAQSLRKFPFLELRGSADFSLLGTQAPNVTATLRVPGARDKKLPVRFVRSANNYTIWAHVPAQDIPRTGAVVLHLDFDRSFVPAQLGFGPDTRHLVMRVPQVGALRMAETNP